MSTVKINWSGGKDSTASCLIHLLQGDLCKIVCYVPMLTDDIPLTERDAFDLCYRYNLISPHYLSFHRDGCSICPNASSEEFHAWLHDFPSALSVLNDIETFCKCVRPDCPPYRGYSWWSDRSSCGYFQYPLWG